MVDSGDERTGATSDLLALQRAARIRNLFHGVRRLLAAEAGLSHDLGLAIPPFDASRDVPPEFLLASTAPSTTQLLELADRLAPLYDRASARVEMLYQAFDLLAAGSESLEAGLPSQAIASFSEAARLVPGSRAIAVALARAEQALQTGFQFPSGPLPGDAEDERDRRAHEGLAHARALAAAGSLDTGIRLLRDLATELPARSDLTDELERLRAEEREVSSKSSAGHLPPQVEPAAPAIRSDVTDRSATGHPARTPARLHPAILVAAMLVLCLFGAFFWAWRSKSPAMPQAVADVSNSTPAVPMTGDLPLPSTSPSVAAPAQEESHQVAVQPAARIFRRRSSARAAVPVGTSSGRPSTAERPTSTVGDAGLLAGKRPEESLLGWRIRSKELERQYAEGQDALNRSDFSRAIAFFSAIVANDPGYADAAMRLDMAKQGRQANMNRLITEADRLRQSGDYQGAIVQYRRVLDLEPSVPEIASRLTETQRQLSDLGQQAFRRATVAYAYGLDAEARASYAVAARMLPSQNPDRAVAEARAAEVTAAGWPPPQTSPLDLANVSGDSRPYRDEAGRFAFNYPARQWKVINGMGSTLVSVDNKNGASIRIDAIRLNDSLFMPEQAESIAIVETRLLEQHTRDATQIIVRKPRPAVPLVIIDYQQQGSNGVEKVRQYSCIRGRDLFRIVASAPTDIFPLVEGVFDQLARSFKPAPAR